MREISFINDVNGLAAFIKKMVFSAVFQRILSFGGFYTACSTTGISLERSIIATFINDHKILSIDNKILPWKRNLE